MFRLFNALFILSLLFSSSAPVFAQVEPPVEENQKPAQVASVVGGGTNVGSLNCFDYYTFGSVQADLQPNITQTVSGATLEFSGTIKNANDYALLDGTLFVKIFYRDESVFSGDDGYPVVDQFVIAKDITLKAKGSQDASFSWEVPNNAKGGEYYAAYFYTTSDRYNVMGLPFTDDVVGNQAPFTVTSDNTETITALSKADTTINGQDYNFVGFPLQFEKDEVVTVKTTLTNAGDTSKTFPIQWNQYAWSAQDENNLRNTKTEVVTIEAGETKEISYEVTAQPEAVVFVTAVSQDGASKSFLNIRYIKSGVEETRINFPGVTSFPLQQNTKNTLFGCAHSTVLPLVSGNTLTLVLTDKDGNTVHQYVYEGDITAAMSGFGEEFTPTQNYNEITLTATMQRNGVVVEEVVIQYDCREIDENSCLSEPVGPDASLFDIIKKNMLTIILIVLGAVAIVMAFVYYKKHRAPHIMASVFLLLFLTPLFLFSPLIVQAKSTVVSGSDSDPWIDVYNGALLDFSANFTVNYFADVINVDTGLALNDGDAIPVGTRVQFVPKSRVPSGTANSDIHWNFTGGVYGTPYGYWGNGPTNFCGASDLVGSGQDAMNENIWMYTPFTVPIVSEIITPSGVSLTDMGGGVYRVDSAGTLNVNFTFPAVSTALFNYTYRRQNTYSTCRSKGINYVDVPQANITFNISVVGTPPPSSCTYNINSNCINGKCKDAFVVATSFGTGQAETIDVWNEFTITATVGGVTRQLITRCDTANPGFGSCAFSEPHVVNGTTIEMEVMGSFSPSGEMRGETGVNGCTLGSPPSNNPPNTPTITGTNSGSQNTNYTFNFVATDIEGHTLRYGIDWDGNGSVDAWVPGSGYVNSGTQQSGTRSWASNGTYTFQVLAQDSQGASSGWASHSITLAEAPPGAYTIDRGCGATQMWVGMNCVAGEELRVDCAATERGWERPDTTTLTCPMNGFSYSSNRGICVADATCGVPTANLTINGSAGPLSVTKNSALTISWNTANVPSCTKFGANWGSGQGIALSGTETVSATVSDTYLINCNGTIDSVSVTVVNQVPNAPTITHPSGSAGFNVSTTFTITGTDPDGDTIYYQVDWDNNGTVDATTITVPSGTSQAAANAWAVSGNQTFQARTVDSVGATSAWTSHVINIQLPPAATATLEASINGGSWSTAAQTINPVDTINVRWSSSNASSCTGSGGGFNTGNSTTGFDAVNTPASNSSDTFTVTCSGPGGSNSASVTITVRQLPNFTAPLITFNPFAFNTTTGTYDSLEVIFQTSNNGGSDTTASANYQFQFDRGSNGYDVSTTGSLGLLAVSASVNRTETVTNVPLGGSRIQVTVDSNNAVSELNEGDNVTTLNINIPPPNPGLNITANRTQIRSGETVVLTWNAAVGYPLNCRVFGPAVNVNPSGLSGTQATQSITAKSEYIFSCTEPITGTVFTDSVIVEAQGVIEEI
jgi:hypothetical protein